MNEGNISEEATWLDLYDWRQRVARMYRERNIATLAGEIDARVFSRFRAERDALFALHPQSPLADETRSRFSTLRYFPYNPSFKLEATLEADDSGVGFEFDNGTERMPAHPAARLRFSYAGSSYTLVVYWLAAYGGGLFLPFRDNTAPIHTYGGGRYLFDTVKGSDFVRLDWGANEPLDAMRRPGYVGGRVIVDFNYAYNPSCAYNDRWVCPLAPAENHLDLSVDAGEMKFHP